MSGVVLAEVTKRFGEALIVDHLSLEIASGEFVVFLGPSGCGKSTLLRMIAGLETVDAGEILIEGARVDHLPPGERGVAMVFQHYALYPHMTIRNNLAFGLRNTKVAEDEIGRRIAAAAQSLEITALLDRRPGQLSGGQRQRAAIARAIVKQPALFLFDEPLSNLDAALRGRTRIELAQLHRQLNATMIFVTHDQVEAMTLASRIVVINERKIEQIGTPMEIYRRPTTQFVASFVGTPKINLLPAAVKPGKDGACVKLRDGTILNTYIPLAGLPDENEMTLGLRPERIRVAPADRANTSGEVQVVERLGERTLVYTRLTDGTMLVAEDSGESSAQPGQTISLAMDGAFAHLFAKDGTAFHGKGA